MGSRAAWAMLSIMGIVALLGYQQYRWIVRVADAEAKTNREKLEASLKAFCDDFDTEITRAALSFAGLTGHSSGDVLEKARKRLQIYRQLLKYSGLIALVDVREALPDPFEIATGPPPVLGIPAGFIPAATHGRAEQYVAIQPFAGAGKDFRIGTGPGMQFGGAPLTVRVVLDQAYLVSTLLPALLDRHLGSNAARRYDVLIRSVKTGVVVFQAGGNKARTWDVSRALFSIRPDCLADQSDRGIVTRRSENVMTIESLVRRSGKCGDDKAGTPEIWTISLQGRPSLAESMTSARRQNLLVSFGVLLVLAVTAGTLFASAHRARELAALHKQFAAGVSHELRTPLSVIASASENLADGVVEDQQRVRQYGRMIHQHSEELAAMIENALWFARNDGKERLEREEVMVEELVNEATAACGRILEQAGVVLERDVEAGLPAILGNRTLLLHGLENLFANIALYGHAGKWARIRARRRGTAVEFTIEDRGAGISPQDITRVFQPFYRGGWAKQTNVAGLGLGLTLVRRIVEAHDGQIELRSERGVGTSVTFRIPIFDPNSQSSL